MMIKRRKIIGTIFILICIIICCVVFFSLQSKDYYTRISNQYCNDMGSEDGYGLKYKYTLKAYDAEGKDKEISFKTKETLDDNIYIQITYMPFRGVTRWGEISYEKLPEAVQANYN